MVSGFMWLITLMMVWSPQLLRLPWSVQGLPNMPAGMLFFFSDGVVRLLEETSMQLSFLWILLRKLCKVYHCLPFQTAVVSYTVTSA